MYALVVLAYLAQFLFVFGLVFFVLWWTPASNNVERELSFRD